MQEKPLSRNRMNLPPYDIVVWQKRIGYLQIFSMPRGTLKILYILFTAIIEINTMTWTVKV